MTSKIMDQRQLSSSVCLPSAPSSVFSEEICLPAQRQIGFWKTESVPDHRGTQGMSLMSGSKSVSSSPLEKFHANGGRSVEQLELSQPYFFRDQKTAVNAQHHIMQSETAAGLSKSSWRAADQNYGCQSNFCVQPASLSTKGDKVYLNGPSYENSLFSSSLSDIFDRKLRISSSNVPFGRSTDILNSNFKEDEPFESLEEVEAQTIGNLLPDDDDLLSGVINDLEYIVRPNCGDDVEDDIFCSGGGMELEADANLNYDKSTDSLGGGPSNCWQGGSNSLFANEHLYDEHPSRTLFVRNINSSIEDAELRALFEQYGEIHMLYTACKHRGFVMISYYDIRAAQNAMRILQSKPLRHRKLDIHYFIPKDNPSDKDVNQGILAVFNLDSSVSNDDLLQKFGAYGEIKEIRETPHKDDHKFIEFYDVRAAEAALDALNGSDIAGKRIKLEPCYPGVARSFLQQLSPELEQKEFGACKQGSPNNNNNNPSGCYVSAESIPLGEVTSNILDNGATQGLRSALRAAISPFIENPFHGTSSVSHCSAARVAPIGHSSSQQVEAGNSVGQVNFGIHHAQTFHPHSLPEYHDGLTSGILFNSSSNMSAMPINVNCRLADAIDHKYIHRVGPGALSHSFEHNEGAFGISATGSCPLHGHQFVWSNSNSYHNHPPGPIIWPNSPSFISSIPAHQPSQIHALQAAPSHMLGTVLPLHHHVGSAPAVNPSLWERRHPYSGDSIEASGFHPGSLGTMGFPGSPLHPLELASRNMFPHAGGYCLDPSISSSPVGILSSQQRCHMLHGRNPSIPMPVSYDAHSDRVRSRRNDANGNNADNKKQFELDIDRIVHGEDSRTTLMIKNIPNKYTSKMLLAAIDEHHRGTYDFIYLPIDFKNKCNVGYAFINMINPQHIIPFYQTFNGKKWEKFNSEKVASLAYARIQGKLALIAHFQNSSLMNEDKRCRPILFHSDGPNAGDQEPFPMGVNVRSRPGRSRTAANEEIHQGSPSNSAIAEESSNTMGSSSGSTKDSEAPKPQPKGEEL